jgi:hypothetical protein
MINNNSANMFNANIDIKMILINIILCFSFGLVGFLIWVSGVSGVSQMGLTAD